MWFCCALLLLNTCGDSRATVCLYLSTHTHRPIFIMLLYHFSLASSPSLLFRLLSSLLSLSLIQFPLLFLKNRRCLRYYLCYTNQINGRHSFLKIDIKCVTEQNCGIMGNLGSSAALISFFKDNEILLCFLEVSVLILRP